MNQTIAYLAQGRLYIKPPDSAAKEITSQFVAQATERAQKTAERNSWKSGSPGEGPDMIPRNMLWRGQAQVSGISRMQIKGVTRGGEGEIIFALDTDSIGGLFAHDPADGTERRLFHKAGFSAMHLARHPKQDVVALSVQGNQLARHIALTDTQGHRVREITEGDSLDECPSWVPGAGQTLVFQSAGFARNAQGFPSTIGPYRIERLDIDRGEMTTLVEDDRFDHLSPRVGTDESLYFIRRPYSPHLAPLSLRKALQDVLFFPFRMARAIVHFCNFFSLTFSGKPLLTAGGPQEKGRENTTLMLWGKMIDAEKAMKNSKDGTSASLVPSTWQLIRRHHTGVEDVLACAVLSFDLAPDGSIIFTDGSTIRRLTADGNAAQVCSGKLIEQVTCLGG
jgi:hypothetical protein